MSLPNARVVFFGSGEIAIPSFRRLIEAGPRPLALVTQPDKPAGRHRSTLTPPPIKRIAVEAGIPVLQPESVREEASLAELRALEPMLQRAASGIEFTDGVGAAARPLFEAMLADGGTERVGQFFRLLSLLQSSEYRQLASDGFRPRPEVYAGEPLNHVLDHIACNLYEDLTQTDLAQLSGYTPTAFSRAFRAHTGLTFVRYVNRLRIDRACELLMSSDEGVADICYQVGFNNLSNFNRHFMALKGMSPSLFRREHRTNARTRFPDEPVPWRTARPAGAGGATAATAPPG